MIVRDEGLRWAAAAVVAVVTFAGGGSAVAAAAGKVIGHGARLKATSIYFAQGTAVRPGAVSATVVPTPIQPVKVQWSLVCQKPNSADPAIQIAATSTQGVTTLHGAGAVKLKLPFKKPPTCIASVYATLAKKGRLVLRLVQA